MKNINGYFYIKLNNFVLNTTFNINNSGITFIIGESGAGKTTFIKCISGLIKPKHGYLEIENKIIQNSKKNIFTPTNKRNVGLIFQTPYIFSNMSTMDNFKIAIKTEAQKKKLKNIITLLKLEKTITKLPKLLSGGEKQRISLAQIILTNPKLLLMDEPFSSQDINMKKQIILFLKKINKNLNIKIICTCHSLEEIYKFGNNLIYMNDGKIKYTEIIKHYFK